jgi:hypothetical protein
MNLISSQPAFQGKQKPNILQMNTFLFCFQRYFPTGDLSVDSIPPLCKESIL